MHNVLKIYLHKMNKLLKTLGFMLWINNLYAQTTCK